jgi:endonuclease/exonuclease/phosphatase family metal-dependent hydrolase
MKLLNLNICIKMDNTAAVIDLLRKENPDIITLQECMRWLDDYVFEQYRSWEAIVATLRSVYPYYFFWPLRTCAAMKKWEKVHRDFGGMVEQGNGILSKFPFVHASNQFIYKHFSQELDWSNWESEDHGRAAQVVHIQTDEGPVQILNVHGIRTADRLGDERTIVAYKKIVDIAKKNSLPTILTGDFNVLPYTESLVPLAKNYMKLLDIYNIQSTRPAYKNTTNIPRYVLDYIFVSDSIQVENFAVRETDISDHFPLICDFSL